LWRHPQNKAPVSKGMGEFLLYPENVTAARVMRLECVDFAA